MTDYEEAMDLDIAAEAFVKLVAKQRDQLLGDIEALAKKTSCPFALAYLRKAIARLRDGL